MARANCKFDPRDARVKFPKQMDQWKKSPMGRARGAGDWEQVEDRAEMADVIGDCEPRDRLCVFAQPPRISQDGAAYPRASLDLNDCNMSTMNGKKPGCRLFRGSK